MATGPLMERNQDATIYVGGLDEKVSESVLWELFVQAGPVVSVNMPKDRITGAHQGFGFVEFMGEEDADYAIKIMNMIKLYGKPVKVNKASANEKNMDVGANLFVGNLDAEVDEKLLFDTFSAFGVILQVPKIMRDTETGNSKGFAFINFASFEASDMALEAMNGQYLCNRPITCSYAFKKDTKGERHGTAAERLLAAQNPLFPSDRPHQMFSDIPGLRPMPIPPPMPMNGIPPPPMMLGMMPLPPGMMPPPPGGMMPPPPALGVLPPPPPMRSGPPPQVRLLGGPPTGTMGGMPPPPPLGFPRPPGPPGMFPPLPPMMPPPTPGRTPVPPPPPTPTGANAMPVGGGGRYPPPMSVPPPPPPSAPWAPTPTPPPPPASVGLPMGIPPPASAGLPMGIPPPPPSN